MRRNWDVVIAGAGPAGLSAALVLGRACRSVLLCDTGTPRSAASKEMHAYLSRDGIAPARFRELSRQEVLRYPSVRFAAVEVRSARRVGTGFNVQLGTGREVRARKLLVATGVYDLLPPLPGLEPLYGRSVFPCPYCDGWEMRGRRIAVYGRRQRGLEMARAMTAWTRDIVLCTDGRAGYTTQERQDLERNGITLDQRRITSLRGTGGRLKAVEFKDGGTLARDALFFDLPSRSQSKLAESLGCTFGRNGGVLCGDYEATSVPGVFVAGNIIRDVQLSIVAAAEGARAAFGINRSLTREDFETRATGRRRIQHPRVEVAS
ncbi:MAG TPA: NAD(P)/FAD-dependent oxidoreductase [Steroidobacteraceae bacterium]|nr:NAD(P)/FAD-dependent oxidoreductase [Steroidobacteraceae bacterium]